MDSNVARLPLFGGPRAWQFSDWTSVDDRVRGGSSYSYMTGSPASPTARFHGNLNITTLGGAGFASQQTTGENRTWDLSHYDGLELHIARGDRKHYTFTLQNAALPQGPDGRQQSNLVWEHDFLAEDEQKIFVKWADFTPTYRGREKTDAEPLDLTAVKRMSLMMRSFFGTQEGPFSLDILSIAALRFKQYRDYQEDDEDYVVVDEKSGEESNPPKSRGWFSGLRECCGLF
ncbi:complex I intermediate-associated protein 30-domain-containing protein [Aspergillus coremiiformis]|uniref:Complex I intermediate-associated protein 30-domain-containing protein n=1 Tax=Aspergillus coremiiformis TaxID=138285 RepID=A0A5N6YY63_9EURO|nr:complex I intermediate-associated protein 30-domain-containing protein [Aspergillus coremiiformis]